MTIAIEKRRHDIEPVEQMQPGRPTSTSYSKLDAELMAQPDMYSGTEKPEPFEPTPLGRGEKIMCLTPWLQRQFDRERRLRELVAPESSITNENGINASETKASREA